MEENDNEVDAIMFPEEIQGMIECFNCDYNGSMPGYIPSDNKKFVSFVCPKCSAVEKVKNPWA